MADGLVDLLIVLAILAWPTVGAVTGGMLGKALRNRPIEGCFLGLLLGFFGWGVILLLPDKWHQCPACFAALPDRRARRCSRCGSDLTPRPLPLVPLPPGPAPPPLRSEADLIRSRLR